jgi:hypothetical protein
LPNIYYIYKIHIQIYICTHTHTYILGSLGSGTLKHEIHLFHTHLIGINLRLILDILNNSGWETKLSRCGIFPWRCHLGVRDISAAGTFRIVRWRVLNLYHRYHQKPDAQYVYVVKRPRPAHCLCRGQQRQTGPHTCPAHRNLPSARRWTEPCMELANRHLACKPAKSALSHNRKQGRAVTTPPEKKPCHRPPGQFPQLSRSVPSCANPSPAYTEPSCPATPPKTSRRFALRSSPPTSSL